MSATLRQKLRKAAARVREKIGHVLSPLQERNKPQWVPAPVRHTDQQQRL